MIRYPFLDPAEAVSARGRGPPPETAALSPAAAYGLSKSGARGGKNSWRTMLYELPMKKGFIFGEWSLPDKDHEILNKQGIHIETVINAGHSMAWENPTGLAAAIMRCLEFC